MAESAYTKGDEPKRQWPDNIVGGDLEYYQANNYSGFAIAPVEHGIPTCGAIKARSDGTTDAVVFNYPGQTEAIAKQLVHRWNCHGDLVEALARINGKLPNFPDRDAVSEDDIAEISITLAEWQQIRAAIRRALGKDG